MIGEILILLALVAGNGLFAGAEIAVLTVRRSRVRELAEGGGGGARALLALRDQPERFLATVQVGITLIGATSAVFGGEFIADPLADSLERAGAGRYAEEIAFVLVVALVTYLSLVIGELVPKSLALRHAERYASAAGRPLLWLSTALRPLVWILTASSNAVLRLFGDHGARMGAAARDHGGHPSARPVLAGGDAGGRRPARAASEEDATRHRDRRGRCGDRAGHDRRSGGGAGRRDPERA